MRTKGISRSTTYFAQMALAVCAAVAGASCRQSELELSEPYIINALVVDASTGKPLSNADVWLEEFQAGKWFEMGRYQVVQKARTNDTGHALMAATDDKEVQVGASVCPDFLAQGMTVLPKAGNKVGHRVSVTIFVNTTLCQHDARPN